MSLPLPLVVSRSERAGDMVAELREGLSIDRRMRGLLVLLSFAVVEAALVWDGDATRRQASVDDEEDGLLFKVSCSRWAREAGWG